MPALDIVADSSIEAPAPWDLHGRMWYLPYLPQRHNLPTDAYSLEERGTPYADEAKNGKFVGTAGGVVIVRYTRTDVGPYDEIMFIPGYFENPVNKKTYPRITTIYVSTEASVRNGRRNWGIPKYLASFQFDPVAGSPSATRVRVSLPGNDTKPFFEAVLTPARFLPSVPVPRWAPLPSLVQPPIPPPVNTESMLLGSPEWYETVLSSTGWARLVWPQPALGSDDDTSSNVPKRYGDGIHFPNCKPAGYAFELTTFSGVFHVAKTLSAEDNKTK